MATVHFYNCAAASLEKGVTFLQVVAFMKQADAQQEREKQLRLEKEQGTSNFGSKIILISAIVVICLFFFLLKL